MPERLSGQNLSIPDDNNSVFGSGQSHIQSTGIVKEAYPLMLIRSNTGQDYKVLLSTLERVYRGYF